MEGQIWRRGLAWTQTTAVSAFVLPFLLYLFTLAPTVYNLDSAELTTAAATGGILRATGYPLYLVLGRIWSWIPLGDVGYRLNLMSAFFGALTVWQAALILRRWRVGPWARLGALGLLATAPYVWSMSLIAEVYTLHTALMAGVLLALLRWEERPSPSRLALPVFLMVLSMGNHAATVLLIPGCLWYVLTTHPRQFTRRRTWLAALAGGVLGATIFLVLPLRYAGEPAFNYAGHFDAAGVFHPVNLQTPEGFLWLVTGRSFAGQMFGYGPDEMWGQVVAYGRQLWGAFFAVGLGPGLVGLAVMWRRDRRRAILLLLFFLANAIFYVNYRVVDKNTMFLPTYLIWALWLGVGYQFLLDWIRQDEDGARMGKWLLRGVMVTAVAAALFWTWPRVDLSHDRSTRQQSEEILQQVEPNAIIFGWWETAPGVQYLQLVEGKRPDVLVINRFLIGGKEMETLIQTQVTRRPIYINNPPLHLMQSMSISKAGSLYRLTPRSDRESQTIKGDVN